MNNANTELDNATPLQTRTARRISAYLAKHGTDCEVLRWLHAAFNREEITARDAQNLGYML